jgi:hypothetical protein
MKHGATSNETAMRDLRDRKKLCDGAWLVTLFIILLAVGVPWYLGLLSIDFGPLAWGLFGFGGVHFAMEFAARDIKNYRTFALLIGIEQCVGTVFVGAMWHYAGNDQNPLFLLIFALPLMAGGLSAQLWQASVTTALSVVTVSTVVWIDSPDFRWQASQLSWFPHFASKILLISPVSSPQPFPGLDTSPSYITTLLLTFALGAVAVTMVSASWNYHLGRLDHRLTASRKSLDEAESLALDILRSTPWPTALVYRDTFQIFQASNSFLTTLLLQSEQIQQDSLFDLVKFSDPEAIVDLITGSGGELAFSTYRVGQELRIARVGVHLLMHEGVGFAYLSLHDLTDDHCLQLALNTVEQPLIVLSSARRILYFNTAAHGVFANLDRGADAQFQLQVSNLPSGWWELGAYSKRERQVQVDSHRYRALCLAGRIKGEKEALTILSFQPMGNGT